MGERTNGGVGRFGVAALLLWLLVLDLVLLGVAADSWNRIIGGNTTGANGITPYVVLLALIEGTFLGAAIVVGLSHAYHYTPGSVGSAFATSVIAWGVDILALGFAAKEINIGGQGSRAKVIESFIIVIGFFETIYMLILLGGLHHQKLGVGYSARNAA
ncbi:unnamed protein product [Calypogeia fissa]